MTSPDSRLRVLFVHEVNWRQKVVYEIHDYPELLSIRGHKCVFIDFPEGERPAGRHRLIDLRLQVRRNQSRAHAGASIEVRTPGRVLPPPMDRVCASLTQLPCLYRALKYEQFDAMVLYAVPTNGWQALAIARRHGVPVLFRAIDVSHALRKTVYAPLIQRAERYISRNADLVSCNNEALRAYVRASGAPAERTRVDYPGLDLCRFSPGPRSPSLCARYGIEEKHRTVLFMGTLYRFSGLDWFLDEFARVLRQDSQVKLLVFGGGEWESELHRLVRRLGVADAVIAPGFIEYSELADHIRLADVAINPFRSSLVTHCALPGKVLQYLGCGVPTVCSPLKGMMGMVQDGCGISYRPEGPSFVDAVCTLLESADVRASASVAARSEMVRQCNWEHALGRFEDAIRCAIAARRGSQ